jgi:hypothetical protein
MQTKSENTLKSKRRNNMSLSTILQEIEKTQPIATLDLTLGNESTFRGREGMKRAAVDRLEQLKTDYKKALIESTFFIILTGANRDRFSEIASNPDFECFAVDPDNFYRDLASRVDTKLFGRESTKYLFNIANNALYDKALEIGISRNSIMEIKFDERYNRAVTNTEELAGLLKQAVNDQIGSEVVGLDAIASIVDRALAKKHAGSITPVLLNTSDEHFVLDLQKNLLRLKTKTFVVVAGKASKALQNLPGALAVKTVTEETVGETLKIIRTKI